LEAAVVVVNEDPQAEFVETDVFTEREGLSHEVGAALA
jgi:hypothetical protein